MGGSALLIYGAPAAALLEPREHPRSLADRLLGRRRTAGPTETAVGSNRTLLELPSDSLRPLADDFRAFVTRTLDPPWDATKIVRDYLDTDVITVYVRGERVQGGAPSWYVQVSFSACAGMADTSADVAAHWADAWYRRTAEGLTEKYFRPFGFAPQRVELAASPPLFVPLGALGYARVLSDDEVDPEAERGDPSSTHFALDASILETLEDLDLSREWTDLERALTDVRTHPRCWCQLCAPGLDRSRFEQLALVRAAKDRGAGS